MSEPTKKPMREFWIVATSDSTLSAQEMPCIDMSGFHFSIKVREISPALDAAVEGLVENLESCASYIQSTDSFSNIYTKRALSAIEAYKAARSEK